MRQLRLFLYATGLRIQMRRLPCDSYICFICDRYACFICTFLVLARLSVKLLQITNCKCSLVARGHAVHGLSLDHFCSATFQQNESSVNEQYGYSGILTACASSVCRRIWFAKYKSKHSYQQNCSEWQMRPAWMFDGLKTKREAHWAFSELCSSRTFIAFLNYLHSCLTVSV